MSFGSDIGGGMARAMTAFLLLVASCAFLAGGMLVWGIPQLWHWLKPLLHRWTS